MELGLLVLAGGYSSRMGQDKAQLTWGSSSFIEHTLEKAAAFGFIERLAAINSGEDFYKKLPARLVYDIYPHQGPLSGLHAGLKASDSEYVFVLSCDVPLFDFSLVNRLIERVRATDADICIFSCRQKWQPLFGIYRKTCVQPIETMLQQGQHRLRDLFPLVKTEFVAADTETSAFFNVNTPEELCIARARAVNAQRKIPCVFIAASRSGTGKTTFICRLLEELKQRKLQTAVVKSDSHGFAMDQEGKDTWKFSQSGASAVAIVSPTGYAILQETREKEDLMKVAEKISDVDLILIETRSKGLFPALEIEREGYTTERITKPSELAGIITDREECPQDGLKILPLDHPAATADYICQLIDWQEN